MPAHDPLDSLPPTVPSAVLDFLARLRALTLPEWQRVLAAARARRPGDPALLDALTVLAITTARLQRHVERRAIETHASRAMAPLILPPPGAAPGDFAAATGRQGGQLGLADQATLQFAAEWAASALLVRDALPPAQLAQLYGPFAAVIPLPLPEGAERG